MKMSSTDRTFFRIFEGLCAILLSFGAGYFTGTMSWICGFGTLVVFLSILMDQINNRYPWDK